MANPNTVSGKLLSFPMLKQNIESPLENWIGERAGTSPHFLQRNAGRSADAGG